MSIFVFWQWTGRGRIDSWLEETCFYPLSASSISKLTTFISTTSETVPMSLNLPMDDQDLKTAT